MGINLGLSGAIGGAGAGLVDSARMANANEMERYRMEAEGDMRERVADRMATRGANAIMAKQSGDAAAAQQVQQLATQNNNQENANTINVNNPGSNVSPTDVATANAGNPLNEAQQAAYGITPKDPIQLAKDRLQLAQTTGNPDVQKTFENALNLELQDKKLNNDSDYKSQLVDIKEKMVDMKEQNLRMNGAAKPTANHQDWQDWAKGLPAGADTSWAAWYRFKTGALLKEQNAIMKAGSTLPLNPKGAKDMQNKLDGVEDDETGVKTYNPETGKFD